MSDVLVKPAFVPTQPDSGDTTKFGPNAWTAARLFSGGNDGEICVRSAASATGAAWTPLGNAPTATLAAAATRLATARAINGVNFDGTAAITVPADASTLTGATLAANVLASSLTSVGALTGGSTGAGFTIALSVATVTGALADGRLSANVPLINAANVFSAIQSVTKDALAAISTDGLVLQNTTAATVGAPVQQSPRLRLRSNVWNTTTPANNTNDWWVESVPGSGTTPFGLLKFGHSLNGAAATYPMTLNSNGAIVILGNMTSTGDSIIGSSSGLMVTSRWYAYGPANGQMNITNAAITAGVGLDFATDGTLKIRNRAQSADAAITASTLTTTVGNITVPSGAGVVIGVQGSLVGAGADGQFLWRNNAGSAGVTFDVTTDGTLKVRNRSALLGKIDVPAIDSASGTLTLGGNANIVFAGNFTGAAIEAGGASRLGWTGRAWMFAAAVGQINFADNNTDAANGVGIDVTTDGVMKIRTRAQSAYATIDALGYKVGGVAGLASFGPAHPASITIVNGIVTACS